jgi:predicted ATPase
VWAVAAALGVAPSLGATLEESVLDALRVRRTLVVLDNCEHLLGSVRWAATAMLRAGSGAVVLATSREPLGVPGEQVFGLSSLDEATAIRLFSDRASDADAAFAVSDPDVAVLKGLCRRLDGFRWRSSWLLPGSGCSAWPNWPPGSISASAC